MSDREREETPLCLYSVRRTWSYGNDIAWPDSFHDFRQTVIERFRNSSRSIVQTYCSSRKKYSSASSSANQHVWAWERE